MKKLNAVVLAAILTISSSLSVFAANAVPNTTMLNTSVPAAEYVLSIPADQEIDFGATEVELGVVNITDGKNFAVGKNVAVTMTYTAFESDEVSTTIPFSILGGYYRLNGEYSEVTDVLASGTVLTFEGKKDGGVYKRATRPGQHPDDVAYSTTTYDKYLLKVNSSDWGKALSGNYTATITFSAEVVVEQ